MVPASVSVRITNTGGDPMSRMTRRRVLAGSATLASAGVLSRPARAATKITFLTSWFAQAEHGGFYQAKASGLYDKAGLDVTIKMGGPQVNALQLLTAGEADIIMGYDIQTLGAVAKGLPVVAIGTSFQYDLQGVMTHADISSIADLKGHTILIATSSHVTFWPWLKQRFGFTDDMAGAYTFNLQPFLVDKTLAVQGYATSEPYEARKQEPDVKFFLFAKEGYPPYGSTLVTTNGFVSKNKEAAAAFVKASLEGWRDYLTNAGAGPGVGPKVGNVLIKQDNPKMTDDRIEFAIKTMKEIKLLDGGAAATQGIGTMTEERWKATYDFLVKSDLLNPATNWRSAFTTEFVKDLHIMLA
jgi:NitT/TauT family transport system substrate-binding protein